VPERSRIVSMITLIAERPTPDNLSLCKAIPSDFHDPERYRNKLYVGNNKIQDEIG
jgi:hypothetical protein